MTTSVTMLTPYPTEGAREMSGAFDSGLNWYSRRLARELTLTGTQVAIVGPRPGGTAVSTWDDDGVVVHSTFVRRSLSAVWQARTKLLSLSNRLLHVQHELFAFGNLASALMLPAMLASLRRRGFRLITTIHGVIPLSEMSEDFVRANHIPGNATLARRLWRNLLRGVARQSDVVHVHEPFLHDLLASEYGLREMPIRVIPFGIEAVARRVERSLARRSMNIPDGADVALFFGYLAAYKGIEYLLAELGAMLAQRPNLHVVIAGSVPSRLAGSIDPRAVVDGLSTGRERVHIYGFVPDQDTPTIFGAADVLLLPYRVAMSSSGPLALAAGFGVPVLISAAFARAFPDAAGLYELKPGELTRMLERFFDQPQVRSEALDFVGRLRENRSWQAVARAMNSLYGEFQLQDQKGNKSNSNATSLRARRVQGRPY